MPSHDPERAYVAARAVELDHKLNLVAAEMASALDVYRNDWSTTTNEMMRQHQDRMRQLRDDQAAWLNSFINGEADQPAPSPNVGQGHADAPATGRAPAPGPGPGQPPNPHAADLEEAERLYALSMAEYAAERQRLIRRPNQGMF